MQTHGNRVFFVCFVTIMLLVETEGGANQHIFQPVTHSVHKVVEIINGNIDLGPELIF